jgi:uncharacterized protein YyaL (SSP411 family)
VTDPPEPTRPANRLAGATSPYLLQHAHNPVDWYPWGEDAFAAARARDVPVFLSVGYAACHWCHVMERESFEDPVTAALLNERFVSVKVDREERPDIDGIYMDAVQAMNRGQGGWPMSVFLTSDRRPFFAGTYFPDEPRHGMPSFRQVLEGVDSAWRERRAEIEQAGSAVTATLIDVAATPPATQAADASITEAALVALRRTYDSVWGGFGGAPKFPQPMTLEFVARMAVRGAPDALEVLTHTLDRMAEGGMYDQIGGGFARYSVDERWHVPHFEKMLYDNAQLASLYTHAWLLTHEPRYRRIARETLDHLLREMRQPEGGFSSSQDADTQGVEGATFTWSWDELAGLVGDHVAASLGATPDGNWRDEQGATNVLRAPTGGWTDDLEPVRRALFDARSRRPSPATDDKVIAAWNGLAIGALAEAAMAFDEPAYAEAAMVCARFIDQEMRAVDGRVHRTWRRGTLGVAGFADDHASLASGLLHLYEATGDATWFTFARQCCDQLLEHFHDHELGGFFQTADDAESLLLRPKDLYDNAVPGGNSAAARALMTMAWYTGERLYEEAANTALALIAGVAARAPSGFGTALCAIDMAVGPSREVAIVGPPDDAVAREMVDAVRRSRYEPNTVVAVGDAADEAVPLLVGRTFAGRPTAYVCHRFECLLPVTTAEALEGQLTTTTGPAPDR